MFYRKIVVYFSVFMALSCKGAQGDETEVVGVPPDLRNMVVSGPYCGVYSLIACLRVYDVHPDIKSLLSPEYIGSFRGSTSREIVEAIESQRFYGKAYSNLSWHELKSAQKPMILHVRNSLSDSKYNHWIAFLGVEDGKARIIDFPHQISTISFADLMSKWDGNAIIVSDTPVDDDLVWSSRIRYLSMMIFLFGLAFFIKSVCWSNAKEAFYFPTLFLRTKNAAFQCMAFLSALFIISIIFHSTSAIGFLKNPTAVAEVTRRYYSVDIPEIHFETMKNIVQDKSTFIIDARYPQDFYYGTIPGSINMAISSSLSERKESLVRVEKNKSIVVFCQSSGCRYADEIAQFLRFNGYSKVSLYRGGFNEWVRRHKKAFP